MMQPNSSQRSINSRTRIPPRVERAMAMQMKKTMPASMQKYVGPYMQQHVVQPNMNVPSINPMAAAHPPTSHVPRPQSLSFEEKTEQTPQQKAITEAEQQQHEQQQLAQPYNFIVNPEPAPKKSMFGNGSSKIARIGVVLGILLVVLIIFSVGKSLLAGKSNIPSLVAVTQNQQQILHLTAGTKEITTLSPSNANFSATATLSISTSQAQLAKYLANNGKKLTDKVLTAGISAQTDTALSASVTTGNYNSTYKDIMNKSLKQYMASLQTAYLQTKGPKGRAILNDSYNQAQLLQTQLNSTLN